MGEIGWSAKAVQDLTLDGLVHDLNNVFQTIIDAADLIDSDPDWSSVSAIIMRSVDQGRRIVSSIVEKDHGVMPFHRLAEHAITFSQDFVAAMKGPALEFTRSIPPGIHADLKPSAIERVLVNLFINASQACHGAGRNRCRIELSATEQDGVVEISVADDGPGVPAEMLPLIFAPRFSTNAEHSGLGLHIVQSLVTGAGGSVRAANGSNGGAVFTLTVPSARVPAVAGARPAEALI